MRRGRRLARKKKTTPREEVRELSDLEIACRKLRERFKPADEDEKFLESFLNADF